MRFGFEAEPLRIEPELVGTEGFESETLRGEILNGLAVDGDPHAAGSLAGDFDIGLELGRLVRAELMEVLEQELMTFAREMRMNLR